MFGIVNGPRPEHQGATVKRDHYDSHDQLGCTSATSSPAYNFDRNFKTLKGLTPYEPIGKTWTAGTEHVSSFYRTIVEPRIDKYPPDRLQEIRRPSG